ncbi:MAG: hypothetical protein RSC91_12730, partial [Clostridia bacterium]
MKKPDLIDRMPLLDKMNAVARSLNTEDITDADDMLDAIEVALRECVHNAHAVDAAPVRRGYWIEESSLQICSECGEEHEWDDYRAPYCDTCGAKMDAEE